MRVAAELSDLFFSDPLLMGLLGTLIVLLAVSIHSVWALRQLQTRSQKALEEVRHQVEERLSRLEYAFQGLDPTAIERRDEDLGQVLRTLLEYTESLHSGRSEPRSETTGGGLPCPAE